MLSPIKRIKLALVLMPAILFPLLWIISLISVPHQNVVLGEFGIIFLQGILVAFVTAYSIASFIEYLRVLHGE